MMKHLRYLLPIFLACICLLSSCDDDDGNMASGILTLTFTGITQPGDGYKYRTWLRENNGFNTIGDFTISDAGNVTNSFYRVERNRLEAALGVLITLEPEDAIGNTPGTVHVLAGDFINKGAMLTVSHPDALGADYATASGAYTLATPTDGVGNNNTAGVWYYDTVSMATTLDLPVLDENWLYETWVVIDDTTVLSLGKFSDFNVESVNVYGSSMSGYPAPGQDFLQNNPTLPTNLVGKRLFMSIEPVPDDNLDIAFGARPFSNEIMLSTDDKPVPLEYIEIGLHRGLAVRR